MKQNQAKNNKLLPAQEHPEKDEEKIAEKIVKLLQDQMLRLYPKGEKQKRQIHPKMNGCVKAEFKVEDNLPPELQVGLFKEPRSFPAWVRFSNGDTHPQPDYKKDIRGCAIKIMGVAGEKIVESKAGCGNQDFILMNTKTFVAKKIKGFYKILKVVTTPSPASSWGSKLFILLQTLPILSKAGKAKIFCDHPFGIEYFSTVPYLFGNDARAVKYAVKPSAKNNLEYTDKTNKDFLRKNMVATLSKNEIVYDFFIQLQEDPEKMPVEDPTVIWTSPFIKMASIRIPTQVFDTTEQNDFGDNLSFNSWHTLPEHRPIGNFNRARKFIYEKMYAFRHEHNHIKDIEPEATVSFFYNTNINQHG